MVENNRVLLVNPEETRGRFDFKGIIDDEPLDLEVLYTILIDYNIETYLYDAIRSKDSLEEILAFFKPTIVYTNGIVKQVPFLLEYCSRIKKYDSAIKTVIGGVYAEHNYKHLYHTHLDYVMRSYDPFVMIGLLACFHNNKMDISSLNGLCYKENQQWRENDIVFFDINKLPEVNRSYFYKNINAFRYLELKPIAQVRTAYSCPYDCSFCYRTSLNCGRYVAKDIQKVVTEIKNIACDNIYIVDDDFLFNPSRLKEFIDLIKQENIQKKYVCYGRTDFILKHKDLIMQLKEIGFYYILVGLESITDSHLNHYNKKISADNNAACVKFLNEIHIHCMGMMIVDLDFKRTDFKNLYKWIKEINLKHVALSIYTPLPGSELYDNYKNQLITSDLRKWDYVHLVVKPTHMSVKRYYFHYYILVFKLLRLAKKHGIYDFLDWRKLKKDFLTLLFAK
ncbi:MAG: radical SAM protein [Lachnospiraceae bacterium]|nr:radical SAM protein [Lachnospiraceae bacterium]